MILVESHPGDDHLAPVVSRLEHRGHEVVVLDSGQFPVDSSVTIAYDASPYPELWLRVGGREHDLAACRAAWWRRPLPMTLDPGVTDPAAVQFALTECHEGLEGLRALLQVAWINDPLRDERATHKPYQLREAALAGLSVPRTVITNDPDRARQFVTNLGPVRTVYKSFLAQEQAWRETRVLRDAEVDRLDLVRHAPVIFQEYVPGDTDLRITVVGDRVQAVAIDSGSLAYSLDFRLELETVPMRPYDLPAEVEARLLRLMRRLGLVYGAIDMRVRPDGEHVFFEVNPSGQWLFVEERTGLPLTDTFVAALAAADEGAPPPRSRPSGCFDCEQNGHRPRVPLAV